MSKREPRFALVLRRPKRELLKPPKRDLSPVRKTEVKQNMVQREVRKVACGGPARVYFNNDTVLTVAEGQNGVIKWQEDSDATFQVKILTLADNVKEYRCKARSDAKLVFQITSDTRK